jgi:hypothetical protein
MSLGLSWQINQTSLGTTRISPPASDHYHQHLFTKLAAPTFNGFHFTLS